MKAKTEKRETEKVKTLTKKQLADGIAESVGIPQLAAAGLVQRVLDGICDALAKGYRIEFRDFGVFRRVKRRPRVGRNPKNPEGTVEIPGTETIKFKPGRIMRRICGKEK